MSMKIKHDGIDLCGDCTVVACNGDYTIFDGQMNGRGPEAEAERNARIAEVDAGFERLGPNLVPNFNSESGRGIKEFTWRKCDCCGAGAGSRYEFAILGPINDDE
jgi:hypothetical protein